MGSEVLNPQHWEKQYRSEDAAWETGRPCSEVMRVVVEQRVPSSRALDIGCGTGLNAIWLAERGFEVTAIDLSQVAIDKAQGRPRDPAARLQFLAADITQPGAVAGPFDFFLDCGSYQAIRKANAAGYFAALGRVIRPHGCGLVLTGNSAEPEDQAGPPVLSECEIRSEWELEYEIVLLAPFRFDARNAGDRRYLGWSVFVRKK